MQHILETLIGLSPLEKENWLNENATSIQQDQSYHRPLTPEEISAAKEEFTETSVILVSEQEKFNKLKDEFKGKKKTLDASLIHKLQMIRTGSEKLEGDLFYFADQQGGKMYVLDKHGNVIEDRKLRPHEKQTNIFSITKTGTQD